MERNKFDQMISQDLDNVFFNKKELAKEIVLSGVKITAIVSQSLFNKKNFRDRDQYGLQIEGVTVSIKENEMPRGASLDVGDQMTIDSEKYKVRALAKKLGIIEIDLERVTE